MTALLTLIKNTERKHENILSLFHNIYIFLFSSDMSLLLRHLLILHECQGIVWAFVKSINHNVFYQLPCLILHIWQPERLLWFFYYSSSQSILWVICLVIAAHKKVFFSSLWTNAWKKQCLVPTMFFIFIFKGEQAVLTKRGGICIT